MDVMDYNSYQPVFSYLFIKNKIINVYEIAAVVPCDNDQAQSAVVILRSGDTVIVNVTVTRFWEMLNQHVQQTGLNVTETEFTGGADADVNDN